MQQYQSSRRKFLKTTALLSISSLLLPPAIAHLYYADHEPLVGSKSDQHYTRADIRSVDFDSHDFMLNFR